MAWLLTIAMIFGFLNVPVGASKVYAEEDDYPQDDCAVYGHDWDGGSIMAEPSCMGPGLIEYHCSRCEEIRFEDIAPVDHVVDTIPGYAPTCLTEGLTEVVWCPVCGTVLEDCMPIPPLDHDWDQGEVTKEPLCYEDGEKTYFCSRCDETMTEPIPQLGHDWIYMPEEEPTCESEGHEAGEYCSRCGDHWGLEWIEALGHDWDDGEVTKQPSCSAKGEKTFHCKREGCKGTETKEIDKVHYTEVDIETVAPTCEEAGHTGGKKCSVCGEITVQPDTTEAFGHDWDEGEVTKEPSCTEAGEKIYHCKRDNCTKTKTEVIKAKGHKEVIDPAVEATTKSTGLTEGSHCSVCGVTIKKQEIVPVKEDNEAKKKDEEETKTNYSEEWVDGKWYDADGKQTYEGELQWKHDDSGWWVEDTSKWYPADSWQKIDGVWYYFKPDGYMAMGEYYQGYWFNEDGSWSDKYFLTWRSDATGWWVEDISGWWPSLSWLKINGDWYYFDSSGYMVTNQYVGGWWIGADGVSR